MEADQELAVMRRGWEWSSLWPGSAPPAADAVTVLTSARFVVNPPAVRLYSNIQRPVGVWEETSTSLHKEHPTSCKVGTGCKL